MKKTNGCTLDCLAIYGKRTYNEVCLSLEPKPFTLNVTGAFTAFDGEREVKVKVLGKLLGATFTGRKGAPFNLTKLCPVNLSVIECLDPHPVLTGEEGGAIRAYIIAATVKDAEEMMTNYALPQEAVCEFSPEKACTN